MRIPAPDLPPEVALTSGTELGGSRRSSVSRHGVEHAPRAWGESVVVKRFLMVDGGNGSSASEDSGDERVELFRRERAGLRHLPGTPTLLHEDEATHTLIMEDLGSVPTLADRLLGDDPELAWESCVQWAEALGGLLVTDPDQLAQFRADLGAAGQRNMEQVRALPARGAAALTAWGVRSTEAARAEVDEIVESFFAQTSRHAISAGDTCPDNAVFAGDRVRFLDCEGTSIQHVAIDAAYALEPFSSCWFVFTPPAGLTDAMLEAFTRGLARSLPEVATDPGWPAQVRSAVVLWVAISAAWLLPGAQKGARSIGPVGVLAPSPRQRLLRRWHWLTREAAEDFPGMAQAGEEALRLAAREWDDEPRMPGYPAWS